MSRSDRAYVFGYGALAGGHCDLLTHQAAHVAGFRRKWNVAMDNRVTLPGYKYYLDPITRDRLALFVTFLNVVEDLSSTINGVLLPVRSHDLDSLDRRERNYSRLEVTDRVVETVAFRVWAYVGSNGARGRYETGVSEGTAVVDEAYYEFVLSRFRMLGDSAFAEFRETTDEPECPLRPLTRVNV